MLGKADSWKGHIISLSTEDDPVPTLYHAEPSYFSQVARLVLEEEGIEYRSRGVDIHSAMEQMEAWYLRISPAGLVPTLVYKGKPLVESRDIAMFAVEKISSLSRLLPKGEERQQVLDLVESHFKLQVEELTMGTLLSDNKLMAFIMPRKLKSAIARLEEMKNNHPDLELVIENKIEQKKSQLKMIGDPLKAKESSLGELKVVLDQLEKNLKETGLEFLCGSRYSLADALFTCLLARLSMINLIEGQLRGRPCLAEWWSRVQVRDSFVKAGIFSTGITPGFVLKKFCIIL